MNKFNMNFFQNNNNINLQNNFQQNKIKCPYKPITTLTNLKDINEPTFINSVLQSFASLKCINNWMQYLNKNQQLLSSNPNLKITKELYNFIYCLYNGQNADSSNFILNFINIFSIIYTNVNLTQDPYNFLFYLLKILHSENNSSLNINSDPQEKQNIETKKNKNKMRNLFSQYLHKNHNSIIFKNFYNRFGHMIQCGNCAPLFKDSFEFIIEFKIDNYKKYRDEVNPEKINENLSSDECFDCFTGGYNHQCQSCGSFKGKSFISFYTSAKVLIIALIRENHIFKCDLNFKNKYSLNDFYEKGIYTNKYYHLKACVSLNNQGKYFSDICVNGYWFRFFENNLSMLIDVNKEIHQFEPQLLFYELDN